MEAGLLARKEIMKRINMNNNLIKKYTPYSCQMPLDSLYSYAVYTCNNDYQRGVVWSEQDQIDFVEYIAIGGSFGSIVVETYDDTEMCKETGRVIFNLIDGQQRVTAIMQFIENKIPIFGSVYFKDLNKIDSGNFRHISVTRIALNRFSKKEIAEYYILMNTKGKSHERGDLQKAESYLKTLN